MREAIEVAYREIEELNKSVAALRVFIAAAQAVCKHEFEPAPDLFNHHTREEYRRCKVCGKTV